MNKFEQFQLKVGGGEDQSRIFPASGNAAQGYGFDWRECTTFLLIACEALSERIAKLEERALKRKMK